MSAWLVISTAAALLFYLWTGINAVRYRIRHKIVAPAMHGHPEVERALRVQGNTLEWLVIFLPALWMFGLYFDPRYAAGLTVVWIIGRWLYMVGYVKEPLQRGPGFLIQALATAILLFGALGGALWLLITGGDV
jgi:glutathione S-transferase